MVVLSGAGAFDYEHRYFDVDVNIVQNETILKSLEYHKCEVSSNTVSTLTDDYESYLASNTGFAIVDSVEFRCSGVHINLENNSSSPTRVDMELIDYGALPFLLAEDVRTFLTFDFDHGVEKIESVIFTLTAGFDETDNAGANFQIITAVLLHPMIDNTILKSQKISGMKSNFNEDFNVSVEFVNPDTTLRGLDFKNCIVSGYDILTLRDKEEGYTGKRGFAKGNLITKVNPTFELIGIPSVTPLLYNAVDEAKKSQSKVTGVTSSKNLFDVNLTLVNGDHTVRSFDYSKCRIVDYLLKTEHDLEESFYNGFALTNEFHFECLGYAPSNSHYHEMFKIPQSIETESSNDYESKQRSTWGPNFRVS